ncbi:threonine synthase [Cellulomonas sp. DKR-3]|uniref:Threonine synthase n=1 Tax=Cellulomonas fulva TaxID=2835530 RepID=A0ABS5TUA3_9CELL|nr:threonine synthase [Cellulomonas fulva]MBT0992717.1 threonine synthase [Cellulomonas fulva]
MAHQWRGVIAEYADRLPEHLLTHPVTLHEGGTPLVAAPALSERTGADVHVKFEGMNPTGSFKDRGMTTAISAAAARGAKVVVCASTGNTSASAAAYATRAGMTCAVLVPDGKIAMGKLSQAVAHGARLLQVDGNFDDCLVAARKLAEAYPVELVNSVNPDRIQGQKTGAFEIVDALGDAPDIHVLPVGNAGNITAYWKGFREYAGLDDGAEHGAVATRTPVLWGFQAAGAAPLVLGHPVDEPETIATAIRIGNPASWQQAVEARDVSGGLIESVTDDEILRAHRVLSAEVGVFVEPASAAGVAGLLRLSDEGRVPTGARITITVTGHGLKDPQWALRGPDGSDVDLVRVSADVVSIADVLGLG